MTDEQLAEWKRAFDSAPIFAADPGKPTPAEVKAASDFYVMASIALPELIAEVERLRAELDDLRHAAIERGERR